MGSGGLIDHHLGITKSWLETLSNFLVFGNRGKRGDNYTLFMFLVNMIAMVQMHGGMMKRHCVTTRLTRL